MYAIFEAGGRQHRAAQDMIVKMDKIDAATGDVVEFDKVLALVDDENTKVGTPYLEGVKVVAKVVQQGKDRKIHVFKYRPKSGYKRARGHRQHFTQIRITEISA